MIFSEIHQFGRRHKVIRAMLNPFWQPCKWLMWVMRSFFLVSHPIKCTAGKLRFLMVNQGQIAKFMWGGGFEEAERDFAVEGIKSGMQVLNIGANAGLYTIIASKMAGASGRVHAFEPSSQNFSWLAKNIEINECQNVVLNKIALADFNGKLVLNRDRSHPDMDGHFFVSRISESPQTSSAVVEEIPCATLDDYWLNQCGGEFKPVDFIVIDVEGAELSVFNGAKKTIAASKNLVMIMECTENVGEIEKFLSDFNFSCYQWDMKSSRLIASKVKKGSFIVRREPGKV